MIPVNIKSGFLAIGIFPFNPNAVSKKAFASNLIKKQPHKNKLTLPSNISTDEYLQLQKTLSLRLSCFREHPSFTKLLQIKVSTLVKRTFLIIQ